MLKQSLIQEKLSDLAVANSSSSSTGSAHPSNVINAKLSGSKSAKALTSSSSTRDFGGGGLGSTSILNLNTDSNINSDTLLPHMPQWPRVQIGTQQIQSNTNSIQRLTTSRDNIANIYANTSTTNTSAKTSPTSSAVVNVNRREKMHYTANYINPNSSTQQTTKNEDYYDTNEVNNNANSANNENIEYDGIETVNYYSSKHYGFSVNDSSNNFLNNSQNNNQNNNNEHFNSNSFNKGHNNSSNNNLGLNSNINRSHLSFNSNITNNSNNGGLNQSTTDNYDPTMKLRYLEKSIKFIQQQHNETLSCLHQEIENLKNENRGDNLFFTLYR